MGGWKICNFPSRVFGWRGEKVEERKTLLFGWKKKGNDGKCNLYKLTIIPVGSRFSDRAHYNEFVESGFKSLALMGRWLVLGVKNTQNRTALCPSEKEPLARGCELSIPLASHEPLSFLWVFLFFPLRDLCCYISFSSVHPLPTLVSHPCPYLSACPIDYSFWRSVSYCDPHRTVQGSHPYQWGQGVS